MIKKRADYNHISQNGISPLNQAIVNNNHKSIKLLLKKGAQIFYEDPSKRENSPLFIAIQKQNVKVIEYLCDQKADLSVQNLKGQTPIIYAALNGYDNIVNYLTIRASNLNIEDSEGRTLLAIYLMKNKMQMVRRLIQRGADINYINSKGRSCLLMAIEKMMNEKVIRFLLSEGANPHIQTKIGDKILLQAQKQYPHIKQLK